MNTYEVLMYFNIETESIREQNIALERVKFFTQEILDSCIFVNQEYKTVIEKYQNVDIKVCVLPTDPFDQIIAIMLLKKLNSIMENKLILTDISITSKLSDNVHCLQSIDENYGPFVEYGWWNEVNPSIVNSSVKKSKNLVKIIKTFHTWDDLYLGWTDPVESQNQVSEVVFVDFDKKTDKK